MIVNTDHFAYKRIAKMIPAETKHNIQSAPTGRVQAAFAERRVAVRQLAHRTLGTQNIATFFDVQHRLSPTQSFGERLTTNCPVGAKNNRERLQNCKEERSNFL
jgi:hypothetical protein